MITLKPHQLEALEIIKNPKVTDALFFGGTGSGKTYVILYAILERAARAPGSRHLCLRSTNIDAKNILFENTFKDVFNAWVKDEHGEETPWDFSRRKGIISADPMRFKLPNGAEIFFRGLDDNKADRMLGADYSTIFISEVSLIDDYSLITQLSTRLRQRVLTDNGKLLKMKFIFDCNPVSKRHWTYPVFDQGLNFNTKLPHENPEAIVSFHMDTLDNIDNLAPGYVEKIRENAKGDRISHARFVEGRWYDDVANPMFHSADISNARLPARTPDDCDDLVRIEVAVDPAVSSHAKSDETGIIVVGVDAEDHAYVLEDLSGVYQPHQWASVAVEAYHRWKANTIIAEKNQGGDMVESTIRTADPHVPVTLIHASRRKEIRAEGSATAYNQGRVHHCGFFQKLEDQLLSFEIGFDRRRKGSPDRLDALVHGLNSLIIGKREKRRGGGSHRIAGLLS